MFILTLNNSPARLAYKLWSTSEASPYLLVEGRLSGIGREWGEHRYSYLYGSGKGASRIADYRMACAKLTEIVDLATRCFGRLWGFPIEVQAVGYLLWRRPPQVGGNAPVTPALVRELEAAARGEREFAGDLRLVQLGTERFPSARHAALFDDLQFQSSPAEQRMYALPRGLTREGRINRLTHGSLRLRSMLENLRKILQPLPRRIILCDIDETTQVTALNGESVAWSSYEYGGQGSLFSATSCGAVSPSVVRAVCDETGRSADEVLGEMTGGSGVRSFRESHSSVLDVAENVKGGNLGPLENLFLGGIVHAVAGSVALLGGLDVLVFAGSIGQRFPSLRSILVGRLGILRIMLDDARNDTEAGDCLDVTGKESRVQVVVARAETDRQIAVEVHKMVERSG